MEPPEPSGEEPDILKGHSDSLIDLNKELDSVMGLDISSLKRPEPAIKQKLEDLCCPKIKEVTISQLIMIAVVAIPFEVYVPMFEIIEDIKSTPLDIVQLGYMILYTLLYEFVLTLAACPHWYPVWLMRYVCIVTPFHVPLGLWIALHSYWNGYKRLGIAMAGCLVGHLHDQFKISDTKAYETSLEAVKEIYQEAYDQMKEDSIKALDEAYALLRKETTVLRQENLVLWENRLKDKQFFADESAKDSQRMRAYQDTVIETKKKLIEKMEELKKVHDERNEKTMQEQEQQQQKHLEELGQRADPWGTPLRWRSAKNAWGKKERR